jgi:hypothetical protein
MMWDILGHFDASAQKWVNNTWTWLGDGGDTFCPTVMNKRSSEFVQKACLRNTQSEF